ncbi:MAG TPA: dephospho-CoA kinase [Desulfobacterales bacterium]|nr:dephospho-CoA kinase [Desulfobacterales bacterium]
MFIPLDNARQNKSSTSSLQLIKVAITGSAGSGKTLVCNRFKSLGLDVIFLDALAREVVAPGSVALQKIGGHFGKRVLSPNGTLNRKVLRQIMINDAQDRKIIERFIHPRISELMNRQVSEAEKRGETLILVEVPLLFEKRIEKQFQVVILVVADQNVKVKRLMDRDNISRRDALGLLNVQMTDDQKRDRADFVITNNGFRDEVLQSVDRIFQRFQAKETKKIKRA